MASATSAGTGLASIPSAEQMSAKSSSSASKRPMCCTSRWQSSLRGKKSEHIALAASGKYDPDKILMVGDAPGDMKAARANDALFFPVNPSREEASWQVFIEEAVDRFLSGDYAGAYEEKLVAEFDTFLPEHPPWR